MAVQLPSSPDPERLRREVLTPATELLRASQGYAGGCDPEGYRANKAAIELHLDRVERIANDTTLPADLRADAFGAVSGLAGILAAREKSPALGRTSYTAVESRADLSAGRDPNPAVIHSLVAVGFRRLGGLKRRFVQMGLGIDVDTELREAANRLSRFPSSVRAQVALDLVLRSLDSNRPADRAVRTAVDARLRAFEAAGRGAEIAAARADLEAKLSPKVCEAD